MRFLVLAVMLGGCTGMLGGRAHEHLLKDGVRAKAVVTAIDQTGMYINNQPQCRIALAVEPPSGEPFATSVEQVVLLTQLAQLQPGTVVTIRYDEHAHDKAIIEGLGAPPTVGEDEAQRMVTDANRLIDELQSPGAATSAMAIVERFDETGVTVNGPNVLAIMKVKVLPAGHPPYDAAITGVFAPSGLHKYQPGREIHVLVDRRDAQRVTIDDAAMNPAP